MKRTQMPMDMIKVSGAREANKALEMLGECLDVDALHAHMTIHMIVVTDSGKGVYKLIAGEDTYRLAKAMLPASSRIPVLLAEKTDDLDLLMETESLISPLILGVAGDELVGRADLAIQRRRVRLVARSMNDLGRWKQVAGFKFPRRRYQKLAPDDAGSPSGDEPINDNSSPLLDQGAREAGLDDE